MFHVNQNILSLSFRKYLKLVLLERITLMSCEKRLVGFKNRFEKSRHTIKNNLNGSWNSGF